MWIVYPGFVFAVKVFYIDTRYLGMYRQIFVYIFCIISICTLVFTRATKSLVLNIERTSQNLIASSENMKLICYLKIVFL